MRNTHTAPDAMMAASGPMLVGCLVLLMPGVGWYIIGYESEPLPSYPELRNCSYYVKLITPLPRLFLQFIYRVLILPLH